MIADVVGRGRLKCTTDYADLRDVDVVLVSVQTPIDEDDHLPRYAHLRAALTALGAVLKCGALVVIESTLAPGTVHKVVIPTLEASTGGKVGEAFFVGHCPERVMPGRLIHNLTNMDRVAGGWSPEVAEVMRLFYRNIVRGQIDTTDLLMAGSVKTTENAYRDVQIAFANEVALVCEALGGDVWTLRELVNKSPGRVMLYPGRRRRRPLHPRGLMAADRQRTRRGGGSGDPVGPCGQPRDARACRVDGRSGADRVRRGDRTCGDRRAGLCVSRQLGRHPVTRPVRRSSRSCGSARPRCASMIRTCTSSTGMQRRCCAARMRRSSSWRMMSTSTRTGRHGLNRCARRC
ncbi:MAG: hypothetical protein HND48_19310 [Chloroflexi bacterium]|nr:hypothetical protein [Chloroflexota bacterium]